MMLYNNTKVKVRSLDGDTDYFDIVAGVLQGDTLATYLFIICLDYMFRTSIDKMKDNGFKMTKERSRRYPTQTITDVDYADDIALLANTPTQTKTLLHSLERAAAGIGLHVNADKTEYMCFNHRGDISTLNLAPSWYHFENNDEVVEEFLDDQDDFILGCQVKQILIYHYCTFCEFFTPTDCLSLDSE